jgi:hypothetical protein
MTGTPKQVAIRPHIQASERPRRRKGRPRGTNYRNVDHLLHLQMRDLLARRVVPTMTAAARQVASRAYGRSTEKSRVTRLVRTYPYR